jgi:hypothetical protein
MNAMRAARNGSFKARSPDAEKHSPAFLPDDPVAQLVEHLTFNQVVARSSRAGITISLFLAFFVGPPMDILLTTFPEHKSRNVGDNLIASSAIKMIKSRRPDFNPVIAFREKPLDGFSRKKVRNVIAPGFSVSNNVYPDLFALYTDMTRLNSFFPIGCSFQHVVPARASFFDEAYNPKTLDFLKFVTDVSGPLPCRDQLIVERLESFGLPAVYSGDLAFFNEDKINTAFVPPPEIKSLVFTIQHHVKYLEQSLALLKLLRKEFPDAKRYVAFHSVPGVVPQAVAARAAELGFGVMHQYGDVANLEKYDDIDLHVGYRLHGHIYFLRQRKPSVLMVEDARAFGVANTEGTAYGCIDAFSLKTTEADERAPDIAMEFLRSRIKDRFKGYHELFSFVDRTYAGFIAPYFDSLAAKVTDANPAVVPAA